MCGKTQFGHDLFTQELGGCVLGVCEQWVALKSRCRCSKILGAAARRGGTHLHVGRGGEEPGEGVIQCWGSWRGEWCSVTNPDSHPLIS